MTSDQDPATGTTSDQETQTGSTAGSGAGRLGRRRLLKSAGSGVVAVSLAGCSGGSDGGDGGGGGVTTGGDGPITLGILTATDYQLGNSLRRGAEIAIDEINSDGGIDGREIETSIKNTEADPQTGQSVYQELTTGENVDATVGTWSSEVVIATLNQIGQSGTLHISAGGSTAEAPQQLKENYETLKPWFRVGPINSIYVGRMYEHFADQLYPSNDLTRVALLGENYAWADSSWDSMLENVPNAGVNIVQKTRYAADTEDFTTIFDQVEENNADVVLALAAYTSTPMVNQWASQQRPFGMTGVINSLQPSSAYDDLNGTPRYTVPWSVATPNSQNTEGVTGPFAEEYINRHGMSPLYPGYCGYDAIYTYKNAVEEAGSIATGDLIEPMLNTSLDLTQGHIEFGQPDSEFPHDLIYDQEDTPQVHFQWVEEDGEGVQKAVYPSEYANSEYQQPDWI